MYDFSLQRRVKLYDPVSFPDVLDMTPFLFEAASSTEPNPYELFSVLVHFGTAMGGHYFAYIKVSMRSVFCCAHGFVRPRMLPFIACLVHYQ